MNISDLLLASSTRLSQAEFSFPQGPSTHVAGSSAPKYPCKKRFKATVDDRNPARPYNAEIPGDCVYICI